LSAAAGLLLGGSRGSLAVVVVGVVAGGFAALAGRARLDADPPAPVPVKPKSPVTKPITQTITQTTAFRIVSLLVGLAAMLAAAVSYVLLIIGSWGLWDSGGGLSGPADWFAELWPGLVVVLLIANVIIARRAPIWVDVLYAAVAALAVSLPLMVWGGLGESDFTSWAAFLISGFIALLGVAVGVRRPRQADGRWGRPSRSRSRPG
jgi:hypothetical protein